MIKKLTDYKESMTKSKLKDTIQKVERKKLKTQEKIRWIKITTFD